MSTNHSASSLRAIILRMTMLIINQIRDSWRRRFTCWIEDLTWSTNTVSSSANWPARRLWWRRISRIWHLSVRTCRTSSMKSRSPSKGPTVIMILSSSVSQKLFRPKRQGHITNKAITPDRISVTDQLNKSKGRQPWNTKGTCKNWLKSWSRERRAWSVLRLTILSYLRSIRIHSMTGPILQW